MPTTAPITSFDFWQMPMTSDLTAVMAAMNLAMIDLCAFAWLERETTKSADPFPRLAVKRESPLLACHESVSESRGVSKPSAPFNPGYPGSFEYYRHDREQEVRFPRRNSRIITAGGRESVLLSVPACPTGARHSEARLCREVRDSESRATYAGSRDMRLGVARIGPAPGYCVAVGRMLQGRCRSTYEFQRFAPLFPPQPPALPQRKTMTILHSCRIVLLEVMSITILATSALAAGPPEDELRWASAWVFGPQGVWAAWPETYTPTGFSQ